MIVHKNSVFFISIFKTNSCWIQKINYKKSRLTEIENEFEQICFQLCIICVRFVGLYDKKLCFFNVFIV